MHKSFVILCTFILNKYVDKLNSKISNLYLWTFTQSKNAESALGW